MILIFLCGEYAWNKFFNLLDWLGEVFMGELKKDQWARKKWGRMYKRSTRGWNEPD